MYLVYVDGQRMQLRDRPLEPQDIQGICERLNVRLEDTFSSGIYNFYCFTRKPLLPGIA